MNILVTGGAGFIGSHITDALIKEGHHVIIVDNLSTGLKRHVNKDSRFYEMDILDDALGDVIAKERIDAIFHTAGHILVRDSVKDPVKDATINIIGGIKLLEHARRHRVRRVIYSSTGGAIYGEPKRNPCTENDAPDAISPYGVSKYALERYMRLYQHLHNVDGVILRYSNVYGPRQGVEGEAGVISIFAKRMLLGQDCTIFGSGEQTRDFIHVSDVVEANLQALRKTVIGHNVLNISTNVGTSINRIHELLAASFGVTTRARHGPSVEGEVMHSVLDNTLAKQKLSWQPHTQIEQGIKETAQWFKTT
ncbi:MAG: NAD-dependent epimerase/dehydratase family protein [Nanoarchaeota archaeon]